MTTVTPDIFVIDDQTPEDVAMLQALYSRSPASVVTHLEKLKEAGSGTFMERYYVGYGHASIGDCGTTTVFIEQVSMLVAKAFQDTPLYSGQEASTRYLDFAQQATIDPYQTPASAAIQAKWMEIYNRIRPALVDGLKRDHPYNAAQYRTEKVWENAINARSFDIARCFLPLGATTLLSWTTNLRQARDHLRKLKTHPLAEVRRTAIKVFESLIARYPHSFKVTDMRLDDGADTRTTYAQALATSTHFASADDLIARYNISSDELAALQQGDLVARRNILDLDGLKTHEQAALSTRPNGAALPARLDAYGRYNLLFLLDFGSFRDIQRHRNGTCQIPLTTARFGLHPWYLGQLESLLPAETFASLQTEIAAQLEAIAALPNATEMDSQYLYPMGMSVLAHVSYSVPQMVYVGELRAGKTVHPSLRPVAQKMLALLAADLPTLALYGDMDADDWTAKRGEQTIMAKAS